MTHLTVLIRCRLATIDGNGLAIAREEDNKYAWAFAPIGAQSISGYLTANSVAQALRKAIAINIRIK